MDEGQKREALENLSDLFKSAGGPPVDVIVTNYNYAQFIGACLESIAAQDYPNWHCTVVDDASRDNSVGVIEGFVQENPERFSLIRHERNAGQMEAFRTGLTATQGDFVLFVDSDDMILPQCLTIHLAAHFYSKDVAFTCSAVARVNENANLISGHFPGHSVQTLLAVDSDLGDAFSSCRHPVDDTSRHQRSRALCRQLSGQYCPSVGWFGADSGSPDALQATPRQQLCNTGCPWNRILAWAGRTSHVLARNSPTHCQSISRTG
jgi:glycosyltransferase involved in cell wall biosynthesis